MNDPQSPPVSLAPLGLPPQPRTPLRILIDGSVLAQEELSLGSGVRGTAVILKSEDLLSALPGAEVGQFGKVA